MNAHDLATTYARHSAAHTYAVGFVLRHTLYNVFLSWEELTPYLRESHTSSSRGHHLQLRIRLRKAEKLSLLDRATVMGTDADLHEDAAHNAGENYERVITEAFTTERWVKDSTPFWVAGDVRIDGTEVQVKLDGAELTNEKTIRNLLAGLA